MIIGSISGHFALKGIYLTVLLLLLVIVTTTTTLIIIVQHPALQCYGVLQVLFNAGDNYTSCNIIFFWFFQ